MSFSLTPITRMAAQYVGWASLPSELWEKVCVHLRIPDIAALNAAHRRTRGLARHRWANECWNRDMPYLTTVVESAKNLLGLGTLLLQVYEPAIMELEHGPQEGLRTRELVCRRLWRAAASFDATLPAGPNGLPHPTWDFRIDWDWRTITVTRSCLTPHAALKLGDLLRIRFILPTPHRQAVYVPEDMTRPWLTPGALVFYASSDQSWDLTYRFDESTDLVRVSFEPAWNYAGQFAHVYMNDPDICAFEPRWSQRMLRNPRQLQLLHTVMLLTSTHGLLQQVGPPRLPEIVVSDSEPDSEIEPEYNSEPEYDSHSDSDSVNPRYNPDINTDSDQ